MTMTTNPNPNHDLLSHLHRSVPTSLRISLSLSLSSIQYAITHGLLHLPAFSVRSDDVPSMVDIVLRAQAYAEDRVDRGPSTPGPAGGDRFSSDSRWDMMNSVWAVYSATLDMLESAGKYQLALRFIKASMLASEKLVVAVSNAKESANDESSQHGAGAGDHSTALRIPRGILPSFQVGRSPAADRHWRDIAHSTSLRILKTALVQITENFSRIFTEMGKYALLSVIALMMMAIMMMMVVVVVMMMMSILISASLLSPSCSFYSYTPRHFAISSYHIIPSGPNGRLVAPSQYSEYLYTDLIYLIRGAVIDTCEPPVAASPRRFINNFVMPIVCKLLLDTGNQKVLQTLLRVTMYDALERAATSIEDTPPTERMSLGDSVVVGPMGNSQGNSTASIAEPGAVTPAQAAHRISIMYKYVMQSLIPIDTVPVNVCVLCPLLGRSQSLLSLSSLLS